MNKNHPSAGWTFFASIPIVVAPKSKLSVKITVKIQLKHMFF
jgi:hypothetical protein